VKTLRLDFIKCVIPKSRTMKHCLTFLRNWQDIRSKLQAEFAVRTCAVPGLSVVYSLAFSISQHWVFQAHTWARLLVFKETFAQTVLQLWTVEILRDGLNEPWPLRFLVGPPFRPPSFFLNFPFKFLWLTYTVDNFRPAVF